MSKDLFISGYPRSGTTYLGQVVNLLFYPEKGSIFDKSHTVKSIEKREKVIVPFRNPLDCIASWHLYPSCGKLHDDVTFYIRFHSAVLENADKVTLLDFNLFIEDIEYIENKILSDFSMQSNNKITVEQVKEEMISNGLTVNLPRNNKEELEEVKQQLINTPKFDQCVELYNNLKALG
jgi:hypothetical protein